MNKIFFGIGLCLSVSIAYALNDPTPSRSNTKTPQQNYRRGTQQNPPKHQAGASPESPLFIQNIETAQDKENAKRDDKKEQRNASNQQQSNAIATCALIASLLQFGGLVWTLKQSRNSTNAQLRAYVFGKGFIATPHIFDGKIKEYVIFVPFENVGNTPALNVQATIKAKAFPVSNNTETDFIFDGTKGTGALGPRTTAQTQYYVVSLEDIVKIYEGKQDMFAWFRVEYMNIFDKDKKIVESCGKMSVIRDPRLIPPEGHAPIINFAICGKQNRAS